MEMGLTVLDGQKSFIYFNVKAPVGPNCVNAIDDVMLVQFLFRKLAQAGIPGDGPELRQKMSALSTTGNFDNATSECILAFQKHFGGIADGRISVARNASYGQGTYTIWKMNFWMRGAFQNVWPRLQDFADCPPLLKSLVPMLL